MTILKFLHTAGWNKPNVAGYTQARYVAEIGDILDVTDVNAAAALVVEGLAIADPGPVTTTEAARLVWLRNRETSTGLPADAAGTLTNDGTGGLSWSPVAAVVENRVVAVPTAGQTTFSLPSVPTDALSVRPMVNGVEAITPGDFTVSGSVITWSGAYALGPADVAEITYH